MLVYADNAATTKMSRAAIEAMLPMLDACYGNPSSAHSLGRAAALKLAEARKTVAESLNCKPKEIFFTSGGSESDNQAILSAASRGEKTGKKHIISLPIEHHAVLHTLKKLEKRGFEVSLLPVDSDGVVSADSVAAAIRDDTCLVTIMFANNEIGSLQPIAQIGAICRDRGVLFHTDAVQAVGHVPVDVDAMNIDYLSASAHKFHGPKGTGFLYARQGAPLDSLIEGGGQERGKRAGTENMASIIAMAAALKDCCENMNSNAEYVINLRNSLTEGIKNLPGAHINGNPDKKLPGNVSCCFETILGEALVHELNLAGICASSGSACSTGSADPSHVMLAIGRPYRLALGAVRFSLCEYNTIEEIEYILKALKEIVPSEPGLK